MPDAPAQPARTPPLGTSQRIRNRGIWAVAFFAASVPPAFVGTGLAAAKADELSVAMPIAFILWALGALCALAAGFSTLRHWEGLTVQTRLLGALPMLTVSFFLTAALIGVLLV
jgi:hypothetical protein